MRSAFCECKTIAEAWKMCPWASVIVRVEGGFRAYECVAGYEMKIKQK